MNTYAKRLLTLFAAVVMASLCLVMAGCFAVDESAEESAGAEVSEVNENASAGDADAAEALIGESLTRDEIEAAVGVPSKFEMSSAGCERGVYGGYFYYEGFSIFSRSYDKGGSFTIVSVDRDVEGN